MISAKLYKIFSAICILLVFAKCVEEYNERDFEKLYNFNELKEDYTELVDVLKEWHPNLKHPLNRRLFNNYTDSVFYSINSKMNLTDFYIILSEVISKINCGHSFLEIPGEYWRVGNEKLKYLPFKLCFIKEKAFIQKNFSGIDYLKPGMEILSINSIPIKQIIKSFLRIYSSDGNNITYKYHKMNALAFGLFPGYAEFPDFYEIDYLSKENNEIESTRVGAKSLRDIRKFAESSYSKFESFPAYDFRIIDSINTGLLNIYTFSIDRESEYNEFLENIFKSIKLKKLDNLILDVRNNDGGTPYPAAELLSYLTDKEFIYFRQNVIGYSDLKISKYPKQNNFTGKLYILINGGCFSTTCHLISLIKHLNVGLLIGEETGGTYKCNGCDYNDKLPNTKIEYHCARCVYRTNVFGFNSNRGILPDFEVNPSIEDLIEEKDAVLDFTLTLIKNEH
ncbi:S41 family peptidase [Bacteroidota bacterium]